MGTSKTARASAIKVQGGVKVIPDAELIRQLRLDVAAQIYPSYQGTHALLRAFDEQGRQLALAQSINDTLRKANEDMATVAGVDASSLSLTEVIAAVEFPEVQS
jgi:hypothetical protein